MSIDIFFIPVRFLSRLKSRVSSHRIMNKKKIRNYLLSILFVGSMIKIGGIPTQTYAAKICESEQAESISANMQEESIQEEKQVSTKQIKTEILYLDAFDLNEAKRAIEEAVSLAGGYVEQKESFGSSGEPQQNCSYSIRIPLESLDDFLQTAKTDRKLAYESEQISDVTLQYKNTNAQLKNLKAERDWFLASFEQTSDADAATELANRLADVNRELESCQAKLDQYDSQISYVDVSIKVKKNLFAFPDPSPECSEFFGGVFVSFFSIWAIIIILGVCITRIKCHIDEEIDNEK